MIVSDNIFIKYYDKETGYGILTDGSYFWYTYWWEDKYNEAPSFDNCMYIDYRTEERGSLFAKFLHNYAQLTSFQIVDIK